MKYTIMFRHKALEDYDGARHYYEQTSFETKEKFEKAISEGLDKISLNPDGFGFRFDDVRAFSLKKFPYLICYRVNDVSKIATVIAVWHQKRDNKTLKRRY